MAVVASKVVMVMLKQMVLLLHSEFQLLGTNKKYLDLGEEEEKKIMLSLVTSSLSSVYTLEMEMQTHIHAQMAIKLLNRRSCFSLVN